MLQAIPDHEVPHGNGTSSNGKRPPGPPLGIFERLANVRAGARRGEVTPSQIDVLVGCVEDLAGEIDILAHAVRLQHPAGGLDDDKLGVEVPEPPFSWMREVLALAPQIIELVRLVRGPRIPPAFLSPLGYVPRSPCGCGGRHF